MACSTRERRRCVRAQRRPFSSPRTPPAPPWSSVSRPARLPVH